MDQLLVNFISGDVLNINLADSEKLFDGIPLQCINNLLWSDTGYKPQVSFVMVYTSHSILLKYIVAEKSFKADYKSVNDPVYKDSCVEFFIAFNNETSYYNLEFNALGTVLGGFGATNTNRLSIDNAILSQIKSHSSIHQNDSSGEITNWELIVNIPFSVFFLHQINSLRQVTAKGNFYKCGDDLDQPHFLSWSPIKYPLPNFHLSQFFAEIIFG